MKTSPNTRNTRQRAAVKDALERVGGFRTAQELHSELHRSGAKIGLSTVYRALQALAATDEVDVLHNDDGEAIYRRCDSDQHHHHLVCRRCGYSVELENEEIERWTKSAARRYRFSNVTHDLELFGTCSNCAEGG